jgi:hypothetical protein
MNENTNSRRGFLLGLTLLAGGFFVGAVRSRFGAPREDKLGRKYKTNPNLAVHYIEGNHLPIRGRDSLPDQKA